MEPQRMNAPPPPTPEVSPPQKHSIGPLIGALIVLVVLILGGLYLWGNKLARNSDVAPFILGDDNAEAGMLPTSNSDAVADIESDVSATDLNTLEADIESDMKAAEGSL